MPKGGTEIESDQDLAAKRNRQLLLMLCSGSALVVFLGGAYFSRNEFFSVDDSFITFTYAWNFLHGHGLVFNVGERYFGTTALGYSLLLAAVYWVVSAFAPTLTLQNVSVILSTIAIAAVCLMLLWASRAALRRNVFLFPLFICLVLYMFSADPFNEVAGHETYPFLSASLAATLLAAFHRPLSGGLLLAFASTLRPDAMLFAPILAALLLLRGRDVRNPWRDNDLRRFSLGFLVLIVPWFTWATLYYGRPIPGTLQAKRAQVLLGSWQNYDLASILSYLRSHGDLLFLATCFALVVYTVITVMLSRNLTPTLAASPIFFVVLCWALFCALSIASYSMFNVTFWNWYGTPIVFSLLVCAYGSATFLSESSTKNSRVALGVASTLIVALLLLDVGKLMTWFGTENVNKHLRAYFETADYLIAAEPNGAVVETAEPGSLAFRLGPGFTVVDELGLITPGVAGAHLEGDTSFANRTYRPEYIVCSWPGAYSACSYREVMKNYQLVGEFDREFWEPRLDRGALLFRRTSE